MKHDQQVVKHSPYHGAQTIHCRFAGQLFKDTHIFDYTAEYYFRLKNDFRRANIHEEVSFTDINAKKSIVWICIHAILFLSIILSKRY